MKKKRGVIILIIFLFIAGVLFFYQREEDTGGERLQEVYRARSSEKQETENTGGTELETADNSGALNVIYNKIENRMTVESFGEVAKRTGHEDADTIYEEWYGGAYIEGGKLIVCVTDESKISDFGEDIVQDASVEFQKVKYSINELNEFQDDIEDKYKKYYAEYQGTDTVEFEVVSSITGIGRQENGNKIVVDLAQVTPEKEEVFKQLFGDYEYIELNNVSPIDRNYDFW